MNIRSPADREGPKDPITTTPARVPGSIRRTTTLDGAHPDGMAGPTYLLLRARDLRTGLDGAAEVLGEAEVRASVDLVDGVLGIESSPPDPRLAELVGRNPRGGWRAAVDELMADQRDERTLLYLLLDAVSAWAGLARFGMIAPGGGPAARTSIGICAGWREGGSIDVRLQQSRSITEFERPAAPRLERADDPWSWHAVEPIDVNTMRRRRRIDVIAGESLRVDAMFRDSFGEPGGGETILHEYEVHATIDPASHRVLTAQATPHVLPWYECPWASGSLQNVIGEDVRTMRRFVQERMRGTSTCTHLNELVRTFADIGVLSEAASASAGS